MENWLALAVTVIIVLAFSPKIFPLESISFWGFTRQQKPIPKDNIIIWRIRSIPREVTEAKLRSALEHLGGDVAGAQASSSNILQLSLAPSSEQFLTATVTFRRTPPELKHPKLENDLKDVKFDTDFLDMTPLYESSESPKVE